MARCEGRLHTHRGLPVLREAVEAIGRSFVQSYGLTESTGGFPLLGPADHVPGEALAHRLISAGWPMAGTRVRVTATSACTTG